MLKVVGMGNALRGDDSIGSYVVEQLEKEKLPVPLSLTDVGSDAFSLLEHLTGPDPVVVVDCARMGANPGTVKKIHLNDETVGQVSSAVSLHGFSFVEMYQMAKSLGQITDCQIIGVEPKSIEFGESLSDEVSETVPSIINMILKEAERYA